MSQETTEGIVLRSFDYKERMRILTLFSKDAGVISVLVKGISKKNPQFLGLTMPFTTGEFIFKRGKSDLYSLIDGTLLDPHSQLRTSLTALRAAGALTQMILSSQLPGKPAPALYFLLRSYFKQIPLFEDPGALLTSFQLKLLSHEGLFSPENEEGLFSVEEWEGVSALLSVQQFSALQRIKVSEKISLKVQKLFEESLR